MISPEEFRAREAATMSEADLLGKIRGLATTLGWLSYHTHDSRKSNPGFPDLVLVQGPRVLYRELKNASGRATAPQTAWLEALTDAGCDAGIWRPADLLSGLIRHTLTVKRDPRTNARLLVIARAQARRHGSPRRAPDGT